MKIVNLEGLYRGSIFQSVRSWIPDQNLFGNDRFGNWRKIDANLDLFWRKGVAEPKMHPIASDCGFLRVGVGGGERGAYCSRF